MISIRHARFYCGNDSDEPDDVRACKCMWLAMQQQLALTCTGLFAGVGQ